VASEDARLSTLWLWHSAEESEHRNTAFDLYRALGGNEAWRRTWFRRVTLIFISDTLRQTVANLRQDGTLWQWRTWASAARFLLGKQGLVRQTFRPWRDYLRADFHPSQHDARASQAWLQDNRERYQPVGG
jgi:predicted metal-dependent hydrolase